MTTSILHDKANDLVLQVEDIEQSIMFRVSDLEQQTVDFKTQSETAVANVLRSDDKLLWSLQKLGKELQQQDPDEARGVDKLRDICLRLVTYLYDLRTVTLNRPVSLIKCTVEHERTKLDRIYVESLASSHRTGQLSTVSEHDVQTLTEEVESLYSEILPVAQMSVEQQYLEPALRSIASNSGRGTEQAVAAVKYVSAYRTSIWSYVLLTAHTGRR